jgi:DNA-binding transcriptional ArsR family regulator
MSAALCEHRWPLQPLIDVSGQSIQGLRRRIGVDRKKISAAAADGLTDVQADRWAIALGWHPLSVWGWDWVDLADQASGIHGRLTAVLRDRIERGDLSSGDRFPTARSLVARYDVSRRTVSRALADLRDEGLVTPGPGGYYVTVARHREEGRAS